MESIQSRRKFITMAGMVIAGAGATFALPGCSWTGAGAKPKFKISLAEWSLHRHIFGAGDVHFASEQARRSALRYNSEKYLIGDLTNLDFAQIARREFDIDAVEYVNVFFFNKARDKKYLAEMKTRADGEGVKSLLIMCDLEGALGDPDPKKRTMAIESHYKWVEAAVYLGCHSIRVNAQSAGSWDEQRKLATEGLVRLADYGAKFDINVIVENHGGISSNGKWLASVMKTANHPRLGTLPDFGNFRISDTERYDNYKGVQELMPFAKAVSAKSKNFDKDGNEVDMDYGRLLKIVTDAGYSGYVGVEYEGSVLSEFDGIRATKALLERVRADLI